MLAAHAMTSDIHKAMDMGFDAYLTQPVDIPTFLKNMDHHYRTTGILRFTRDDLKLWLVTLNPSTGPGPALQEGEQ